MDAVREAFFLPITGGAGGQRLCVLHRPPRGRARGRIVYVHPFAEEMNKSRRLASLQARRLSQAGFAVLQIDLLGCGDSSGDFADASWAAWVQDIAEASRWLAQRADGPQWLWGLRVGCLLAVDAARLLDEPSNLLFWQPTVSGRAALQQFLRLRSAGSALAGAGAKTDARAELAQGQTVVVAGYGLSPGLAQGLEAAELAPPPQAGRAVWFEVNTRPEGGLLPATQRAVDAWQQAGVAVAARVVPGPAFWQTVEIEDVPELLLATQAALAPAEVAA